MSSHLTIIGEYNDRQGDRPIWDRTQGRPPAQDIIVRFNDNSEILSTTPKEIPIEIIETIRCYVAQIKPDEFIRGIEFLLKEHRLKLSYFIND